MGSIRSIGGIIKADFIERTRSYGFLVTIAVSLLFAYAFVPPANAKYAVVMISGYRGVYNSAWIGATAAISTITNLFLLGYLLVKNAIDKDRQTGVGQIIAATPVKKLTYMLGKFLSNFFILMVIVFITLLVAAIMQIVRGEDMFLNMADLAVPFLIVVIPAMAIVAATAILFEAIMFLKGGAGNIVYFFIWGFLLSYSTSYMLKLENFKINISSLMGSEIFFDSMVTRFKELFPGVSIQKADGFLSLEEPLKTFVWQGVNWNIDMILGRMVWLLAALAIVIIAALLFRGFDHPAKVKSIGILSKFKKTRADKYATMIESHGEYERFDAKKLAPVSFKFSFMNMVAYELKLMLKGQKWWWYMIQGFLIMGCIISPIAVTKSYFGPLSWFWPLLIWSSMGIREVRNCTHQIVFSSPYPLRRQFPATWLSGFIVALLSGSGMVVKFLMAGDVKAIPAWCVGAMFIPTLAYMLGIWTRTSKTFEGIYLVMMFAGLLNKVMVFDFIGVLDKSIEHGMPFKYLMISVLSVLIALYGRKRQAKI